MMAAPSLPDMSGGATDEERRLYTEHTSQEKNARLQAVHLNIGGEHFKVGGSLSAAGAEWLRWQLAKALGRFLREERK